MGEHIAHVGKESASGTGTAMGNSAPCLFVLLWLAIGACMGGCASKYSSSAPAGDLFVKIIPSSWVRMSNISTDQEADELVIAGDVSRRNSAFSGKGHVDVAVVSLAGTAICKASADYTPAILAKTAGARNHRSSHFEVDLPCTPPPKSIIRIAYHNKSGPDDPHPGCEDNAALPNDHNEIH